LPSSAASCGPRRIVLFLRPFWPCLPNLPHFSQGLIMSALYFGTGLASPKYGASRGLPFEYLDFFCNAFELAQQNGCERVIQDLTDCYEIPAPAPAAEVQTQIDLQPRLVNQLAQSLGVADRF